MSDFRPVLLQMQPRDIPEAIKSIKDNINIPKVWFKAFTEPQVCDEINKFVARTNYSHYIINADDVVLTKEAVDCVLENAPNYDVFTGWVNMHLNPDRSLSALSNVCFEPITLAGTYPVRSDYPWVNCDEVFLKEGNLSLIHI